MLVDPRVSKAYYNGVQGAIPTANTTNNVPVSWKFPCNAVMPNLYIGFTDGYVMMSGRQMSYDDPDAENSEFDP